MTSGGVTTSGGETTRGETSSRGGNGLGAKQPRFFVTAWSEKRYPRYSPLEKEARKWSCPIRF